MCEDESNDSGSDYVLRMLRNESNPRTEKATGKEETKSSDKNKKNRYPLFAAGEKAKQKDSGVEKDALAMLLKGGLGSMAGQLDSQQLTTLMQMELLRELRDKKSKPKASVEEYSEKSDSSLDSSLEEEEKLRGAGKAMRAYRKNPRCMRRKPEKDIKRYIREVEECLGVSQDGAYMLTDFTKKLAWGKNHTLFRIHFALSHILQTVLQGKLSQVGLRVTQLLRAVHQANLDDGSWKTAWLLLDIQEPQSGAPPFWRGDAAARSCGVLPAGHERLGEEKSVSRSTGRRSGWKSEREGKGKKTKRQKTRKSPRTEWRSPLWSPSFM